MQEVVHNITVGGLKVGEGACSINCDVLVLGCDELDILDTLPQGMHEDLHDIISLLSSAIGEHAVVLGTSLFQYVLLTC
jgi:hypothetical protein